MLTAIRSLQESNVINGSVLANAAMEAMIAIMWMRQFLTSSGSFVPSAWKLKPIVVE